MELATTQGTNKRIERARERRDEKPFRMWENNPPLFTYLHLSLYSLREESPCGLPHPSEVDWVCRKGSTTRGGNNRVICLPQLSHWLSVTFGATCLITAIIYDGCIARICWRLRSGRAAWRWCLRLGKLLCTSTELKELTRVRLGGNVPTRAGSSRYINYQTRKSSHYKVI